MMDTFLMLKLFFSSVISFLVTFYLVPIFSSIAHKLGIVDVPDGKIKTHKKPTPYLGGVAVYGGFITALALVFPFENQFFAFLLGSTLLLFVGLIDDLIVMKPYQKWFGQIIATLCFLRAGFHLKEFFFFNYWHIVFSFFWMLTVINAFNLVDVMDGLATTLALTAACSFLVIALLLQQWIVALLLASFIGALAAFLYYNKPAASIYLGDTGALFIGGLFATVPFLLNWGMYSWYGYLTPVIILAIPLLEVAQLVVIRLYKGLSPFQGSPDHFSIYLQQKGWSKQAILGYVTLLSLFLLCLGLLLLFGALELPLLVVIAAVFLLIWFVVLLVPIKK